MIANSSSHLYNFNCHKSYENVLILNVAISSPPGSYHALIFISQFHPVFLSVSSFYSTVSYLGPRYRITCRLSFFLFLFAGSGHQFIPSNSSFGYNSTPRFRQPKKRRQTGNQVIVISTCVLVLCSSSVCSAFVQFLKMWDDVIAVLSGTSYSAPEV